MSGRVDEQTQLGKVRRRSRAEMEQLVADFEAGGMGRVEFCQRHGLSLATLGRYRKRCETQAEATAAGGWVAVELCGNSGAGSGLAVALAKGRRIEVERGFDAHTLTQLLDLLERR